MDYKPGVKTSEFSLTALLTAIGALLTYYGVTTDQEAQLWVALFGILLVVVPNVVYTIARTWYKAKAEFEPTE